MKKVSYSMLYSEGLVKPVENMWYGLGKVYSLKGRIGTAYREGAVQPLGKVWYSPYR
jgi:hypothetical protein